MTYKAKIVGLSLLAAALTASLILGALYSYRGSESRSARPLASFVRTGTVSEIVFQDNGKSVLLAAEMEGRAGRTWSVVIQGEKFPAVREKVERFIELVDTAQVFPALTENEETWGLFGVEDSSARRIKFSGSGGATEVILGGEDEAGRGQYIRFAGASAVYLAGQSFSYYAERDAAYWSDLRVFPASLTAQDIIGLSAAGAVSWRLFRETRPEGLLWTAEGAPAKKLNQGKADSLATALCRINAKSFVPGTIFLPEASFTPGADYSGLGTAEAVFILTASNKERYELCVGSADEEGSRRAAARVSGETLPYLYLLDAHTLGRIMLPLGDIEE
ncbi:MAG: DUF4340 domain-containing protein [Spirochaetaceae bacterium]|nr:DUF4340 domain-containing protein [Spirochaetaceae bacterium]